MQGSRLLPHYKPRQGSGGWEKEVVGESPGLAGGCGLRANASHPVTEQLPLCEGVSVVAEVARQKVASRKVVGDEASFLSTPTGGGRLGNVVQHVPVPECPG